MQKTILTEPTRWSSIIEKCQNLSTSYSRIDQYTSIGADIFVFVYPIFLVILYSKGLLKKEKEPKEGALFIFFACLISTLINIGVQCFFQKERPIVELSHLDTEETILHQYLPESSFPSDHAVVSMSFAMATLLRGYKVKNKKIIVAGYCLIVISLLMCSCRVLTLVHRPTDILWGMSLAIMVVALLFWNPIYNFLKKFLITPCINLQEKIFKR